MVTRESEKVHVCYLVVPQFEKRVTTQCHSAMYFQHAPIKLGTLIHGHLLPKVP